ncbi:MAG: 1,4-dihydroxy-6-naphthoate synthase [Bacteroidetes bacterium GWA2_30_7]|nr:MAG: 1,4-dihydroxy-6-naphthoate synthase [Bacteroidetes bacterium GWA2_30_7]
MKTKITLGFSPCPNDTFIFDALVNRKIENKDFEFELKIADVEELNKMILNSELDVSKISYHLYPFVNENYQILNSGSALGNNNGPILISKHKIYLDEINNLKIAIPGKYTTANLLFSIFFPNAKNKHEYLFSDIEEVILSNEVYAGLIIHETRFTYMKHGLKKIIDLGEKWENEMKQPLPLGGISIKRTIREDIKLKINNLISSSVKHAFENPLGTYNYIKQYSQSLSEEVIQNHINLYVNNFTIDLKEKGRNSIETLFKKAIENKLVPELKSKIFI